MASLLLTFILSSLPGVAAFLFWGGPRADESVGSTLPEVSLPEAAVLRDGAAGATRWAFAAMLVKLARDGHCTIVRTRGPRWLCTGPTVTLTLHADLSGLSPFEQTVLRQLGRHDTLGGFGFAGSTFRRRTLRDVRATLVERGWLEDRHRRSNACLALGLVGLGVGLVGLSGALGLFVSVASLGLGTGSLLAAIRRYPVTEEGARHRAAHRAYAEHQRDRIRRHLSSHPDRAAALLIEALPALVLERVATPRWLSAVASHLEDTGANLDTPTWIRDEIDGAASFSDACRTLGHVLRSLGARTPLWRRPIPPTP